MRRIQNIHDQLYEKKRKEKKIRFLLTEILLEPINLGLLIVKIKDVWMTPNR